MKRLERDVVIVIAAGLLILLMWVLNVASSVREQSRNAITETTIGGGSKTFFDLKNQLLDRSATRWRRPLLKIENLQPFQTYFLLSPKRPLSTREEKILLDWVKAGGNLVLSFEDNLAATRVNRFLTSAGISANLTEQPDFKNGTSTPLGPSQESSFFKPSEHYEFYSLLGFRDGDCLTRKEQCFYREAALGSGRVVAFAGVPPFANALIDRADNAKIAARVALWSSRSAFDEYHQFLSEKKMMDLLLDPTVLFPLVGFLILIFIYFFFGAGDLNEQDVELALRKKPATSYHALNKLIMNKLMLEKMALSDAGRWQAKVLQRILPREKLALKKIEDQKKKSADFNPSQDVKQIVQYIQFHQEWLKKRGRKPWQQSTHKN